MQNEIITMGKIELSLKCPLKITHCILESVKDGCSDQCTAEVDAQIKFCANKYDQPSDFYYCIKYKYEGKYLMD